MSTIRLIFVIAGFSASSISSGQVTQTLPVHSTIDLTNSGCRKVLDYTVSGDTLHALCFIAGNEKAVVRTTLDGQILQVIKPIPLRQNSCGITVAPSGRTLVWAKASPSREVETVLLTEGNSLPIAQSYDMQIYDMRLLGNEDVLAANALQLFRGAIDGAGKVFWREAGTIDSLYPLLVFPTDFGQLGVLDFTRGTMILPSGNAAAHQPVRIQLAEIAHLPSTRDDETIVPAFYSADWGDAGHVFALAPEFRHEQGVLLLRLSTSGAVTGRWRLAIPTHAEAVTQSHPVGHEIPSAVRIASGKAFVLSLRGPRFSRYELDE